LSIEIADFDSHLAQLWDTAERTTIAAEADGVDILAVTEGAGQPKHVILVAQYRPPLGKMSLEFPAGLVDAGETCEQAAIRELKEETYESSIFSCSPCCILSQNPRILTV
jgi:ADP-ribose pyrophosphatase